MEDIVEFRNFLVHHEYIPKGFLKIQDCELAYFLPDFPSEREDLGMLEPTMIEFGFDSNFIFDASIHGFKIPIPISALWEVFLLLL